MRAAPLRCKNTEKMASFPYIFPPQASALLIGGQVHREDGDGWIFFFSPFSLFFFPKAELKLKCCCCIFPSRGSVVSGVRVLVRIFGPERVVTTLPYRWKRRSRWTTRVPQTSAPGERGCGWRPVKRPAMLSAGMQPR